MTGRTGSGDDWLSTQGRAHFDRFYGEDSGRVATGDEMSAASSRMVMDAVAANHREPDDEGRGTAPADPTVRCLCRTPWGTQCNAEADGDGFYCGPCISRPVGEDGRHWCPSSSSPAMPEARDA